MKRIQLLFLLCVRVVFATDPLPAWTSKTITAPPYYNGYLQIRYMQGAGITMLPVDNVGTGACNIYSDAVYKFNSSGTGTLTQIQANGQTDSGGACVCVATAGGVMGTRHPYAQSWEDTISHRFYVAGGTCNGVGTNDQMYMDLQNPLTSTTFTTFVTTHSPWTLKSFSQFVENACAFDPDDAITVCYGTDNNALTNLTIVYCPTYGTGSLTAAQTSAGCTGADDWAIVSTSGGHPTAVNYAGLLYDTVNKKFVLFGGRTNALVNQNETWTYTPSGVGGKTWSNRNPASPPSAPNTRGVPVWAFVPFVGKVYLHDMSTGHDWTYDVATNTWTDLGANGPTGTAETMTYDSANNKLVMWRQGAGAQIWMGAFSIPPTITTTSLANGQVGSQYSQSISTTGSPTCSVTSGSVPTGTSLSSGCVLSGTPTVAGLFSFVVTATNGNSPDATQAYSINITGTGPGLLGGGQIILDGAIKH